jgi:hypothetical protein
MILSLENLGFCFPSPPWNLLGYYLTELGLLDLYSHQIMIPDKAKFKLAFISLTLKLLLHLERVVFSKK